MDGKTFGERVREIRKELGLSQTQLAKRLDVDPASVAYIELRDNRPQARTVKKYADALGVDVSAFGIELPAEDASFGKRIRAFRMQRNWTQWDLAKRMGVGQGYINNMELQKHEPQMKTVRRFAAAFGITMDELCNGAINVTPTQSTKSVACRYCGYESVAVGCRCPQCNAVGGE